MACVVSICGTRRKETKVANVCNITRKVSVSVTDLPLISTLFSVMVIHRDTEDHLRAFVETNRYQRRELTRYGIPFRELTQ